MKGIMVNAMLISGNEQKKTYVFTSQFGIHYIVISFLELNRVYYNDCIYEADFSKRHTEMYVQVPRSWFKFSNIACNQYIVAGLIDLT